MSTADDVKIMRETAAMHFTEEHIMMRKMVRDFARKEIAPVVEFMESTDEFPERLIKKWAKRD